MTIQVPIEIIFYLIAFVVGGIVILRVFSRFVSWGGYYPTMMPPGRREEPRGTNIMAFFIPLILLSVLLLFLKSNAPPDPPNQKGADLEEPLPPHKEKSSDEIWDQPSTPDPIQTSDVQQQHDSYYVVNEKLPKNWHVQVMSCDYKENAKNYAIELINSGINEVGLINVDKCYKVVIGRFQSEAEAIRHKKWLKANYGINGFQVEYIPLDS